METTYGDRDHRSLQASVDELFAAIRGAQRRGGNVIIPTFALERAQELQFFLRQGVASGAIGPTVDIYLDLADGDLGHAPVSPPPPRR
ncbi:hypothetical protein ACFOHS_02660 [Jhaorihella thermophila]